MAIAERSLAADDDTRQVVAGIVLGRSAELDDRAVGQHHFDAQHVVDRDAVLQRVRSARIGREIAADGAGPLARGVGRVVKAGSLESLVSQTLTTPGSTTA